MNPEDFSRLANNFYNSKNLPSIIERINLDADIINYFLTNQKDVLKKHKIAFVFICLNPLYWQYANEMVKGAKQFFLPGHHKDFLFWTDIPDSLDVVREKLMPAFTERGLDLTIPQNIANVDYVVDSVKELKETSGVTIFPTESVDWPYPTLLRYNLFLQQEEKLKEYDYIFYCDVDMQFVSIVGDEVLSEGLTAAPHPGYYIRKQLYPPYEPNSNSASYIKRPGKIVTDEGKPRFMPQYYAGGFQGGKSNKFIQAMKDCKKLIDTDLGKNYIPIWNDETAWNKYLSENPPEIFLTPSYIYPDSLIKEYYEPIVWGQSFQPKLITITKWFSVSKDGGKAVSQMIAK